MVNDFSQSGEIRKLYPIIEDHPSRLVVDVGANDGEKFSNSRSLIQLGWRGILIEPNPHTYQKLHNLYKGSESVITFEGALSNFMGTTKLYADHEGMEGLSLGSTIETDENDWSKKVINRQSYVDVRTETLSNVILHTGYTNRNFALLSVDTEGHDTEVLEGLGHFRPSIILTERHMWDFKKTLAKQLLLTTYGYVFAHHIGCNEVYFYSECAHLKTKLDYINTRLPYM